MKKPSKESVIRFVISHKICLGCGLIGFLIGPAFFFGGLIVGFFADLIVDRLKDDRRIKSVFRDERFSSNLKEPFSGCLVVCALAVFSLGDSDSAGKLARIVFGKKVSSDWESLCRLAASNESLNGDLLTETLASKILHDELDKTFLPDIFAFLHACEFNWNENDKGQKPSVYLSELLNYCCKNDELENAYRILGLEKKASSSEVKKAHRKLAAKYHPDADSGNEEMFIKIQKAYEIISKTF